MKGKRKLPWIRVTNEYVATFATKDCEHCKGEGYFAYQDELYSLCSCSRLNFKKEMIDTGKVRQRTQRINDRDVTWQEYRTLGEV